MSPFYSQLIAECAAQPKPDDPEARLYEIAIQLKKSVEIKERLPNPELRIYRTGEAEPYMILGGHEAAPA